MARHNGHDTATEELPPPAVETPPWGTFDLTHIRAGDTVLLRLSPPATQADFDEFLSRNAAHLDVISEATGIRFVPIDPRVEVMILRADR